MALLGHMDDCGVPSVVASLCLPTNEDCGALGKWIVKREDAGSVFPRRSSESFEAKRDGLGLCVLLFILDGEVKERRMDVCPLLVTREDSTHHRNQSHYGSTRLRPCTSTSAPASKAKITYIIYKTVRERANLQCNNSGVGRVLMHD
jgi:hypothetical protein